MDCPHPASLIRGVVANVRSLFLRDAAVRSRLPSATKRERLRAADSRLIDIMGTSLSDHTSKSFSDGGLVAVVSSKRAPQ